MTKTVSIGGGAGFADERPDAVDVLVRTLERRHGPRYVILETLAERTLALAQLERRRNPDGRLYATADGLPAPHSSQVHGLLGHSYRLQFRCGEPHGRRSRGVSLRRRARDRELKVAVVEGDDLLGSVSERDYPRLAADRGTAARTGAAAGGERLSRRTSDCRRPRAPAPTWSSPGGAQTPRWCSVH